MDPEKLEKELRFAVLFYQKHKDSRSKTLRTQSEFWLGVVKGIMDALDASGQTSWKEEIIRQIEEDEWRKSEAGQAWSAAERWMGRTVFRGTRGIGMFPGKG